MLFGINISHTVNRNEIVFGFALSIYNARTIYLKYHSLPFYYILHVIYKDFCIVHELQSLQFQVVDMVTCLRILLHSATDLV